MIMRQIVAPIWQTTGMLAAHSHIDWGNVPAWVASILTGGSLLLGFYILLRDRRKEERRQARRIVIQIRMTPIQGDPNSQVKLTLRNTSDQPIALPFFQAVGRPAKQMRRQLIKMETPDSIALLPLLDNVSRIKSFTTHGYDLDGRGDTEIEAGESREMHLDLPYPAWCYDFSIHFRDASGASWIHDCQRKKLLTFKGATRIYFGSKRLTQWRRNVIYRRFEVQRFFLG